MIVQGTTVFASVVFIKLINQKIQVMTAPMESERHQTYCIFTLLQFQSLKAMHYASFVYHIFYFARYYQVYKILNSGEKLTPDEVA